MTLANCVRDCNNPPLCGNCHTGMSQESSIWSSTHRIHRSHNLQAGQPKRACRQSTMHCSSASSHRHGGSTECRTNWPCLCSSNKQQHLGSAVERGRAEGLVGLEELEDLVVLDLVFPRISHRSHRNNFRSFCTGRCTGKVWTDRTERRSRKCCMLQVHRPLRIGRHNRSSNCHTACTGRCIGMVENDCKESHNRSSCTPPKKHSLGLLHVFCVGHGIRGPRRGGAKMQALTSFP